MMSLSQNVESRSDATEVFSVRLFFAWYFWAREMRSPFRGWDEDDFWWHAAQRPCDGFASGLD